MTTLIYAVETQVSYKGKIVHEFLSNLVNFGDFEEIIDDEFWIDNAKDLIEYDEESNTNPNECEYLVSYGRFVVEHEEKPEYSINLH